jgi:hypothetical protein
MSRRDKNCPKKATKEERFLAADAGISVRYLRSILRYGNAPVSTADRLARLTGQPIERFIYRQRGSHTANSTGAAATAPVN